MSSTHPSISSIELVQPEIDSTIQQAEESLSRFVDNRDSGESLQNCIDCLNQLRGIFVLVEIQSCVLLCQQSVVVANEVPVGASDDKNGLLSTLSNAIFVLRRYTEYFGADKKDHPELLLPVINELRAAVQEKPYPESHFFEFDSRKTFDLTDLMETTSKPSDEDFERHAKRFRHMFQIGLLDTLKDRNLSIALKLMARASQGSAKLCHGEPLAQMWFVASLLLESFQIQSMEVTSCRKRLLMRLERYLREMALTGSVVSGKSAPDSLKKDFLYLLALSGDTRDVVMKVLDGYNIKPLDINELELRAESKRLFGPGVDVLRSLSKAIAEEMSHLKEKLDIFERGGVPNSEDIDYISEGLGRLSGTVSMLDLPKVANLCIELNTMLSAWKDSDTAINENELLVVANGILMIESAIKHYENTGEEPELQGDLMSIESSSSSYLNEARIVVIDEATNGLVLAKRSISSFVETNGDKLHLANIGQVMDTIRGGMVMIDQSRVAAIVHTCGDCIQKELLTNDQMPDEGFLETLADALTSLEYFVESMNYKDSRNEELLKLSEESLKSLGYQVS